MTFNYPVMSRNMFFFKFIYFNCLLKVYYFILLDKFVDQVITGGAMGLGFGIAQRLGKEGETTILFFSELIFYNWVS